MTEQGIDGEILAGVDPDEVEGTTVTAPVLGGDTTLIQMVEAANRMKPRNRTAIMKRIKTLAFAAGENYYYRWQAKNRDGTRSWIEGGSIKLANDLAREYGKIMVGVRATDEGDHWDITARCIDLETMVLTERSFRQRKGQQTINSDDAARKLDIVYQIGQSKAIRNTILNALQIYADYGVEQAKKQIVERVGKDMDHYRERVLASLEKMGVPLGRVEHAKGKPLSDWLAPDLAAVIAEIQTIEERMGSANETWPTNGDDVVERPSREALPAPAPTEEPEAEQETTEGLDPKELLGTDLEPPAGAVEEAPTPAVDPLDAEELQPAAKPAIPVPEIGNAKSMMAWRVTALVEIEALKTPEEGRAWLARNEDGLGIITALPGNHAAVVKALAAKGVAA